MRLLMAASSLIVDGPSSTQTRRPHVAQSGRAIALKPTLRWVNYDARTGRKRFTPGARIELVRAGVFSGWQEEGRPTRGSFPWRQRQPATSRAVILYLNVSGSRLSTRSPRDSACGYIRNATLVPFVPGSAMSCASL